MQANSKKTLHSLDKYTAIGFDVDHCIIRYRLKELYPILYKSIATTLVQEKGYPQELLEFTPKEKSYIMNGLIIDYKTGYILKLGKDKVILRAFFGYERVEQKDLEAAFGSPPRYEIFNPYECRTNDYTCCLTFFECYVPALLAHMIEYKKKTHHLEEVNAKEIMNDALYAVMANYAHYNDKTYHSVKEYGKFFPEAVNKIADVIYKQDKMLQTLKHLKEKGKILFIASNSHYEYVNILMEHAFGAEWDKLFDFIIVKACKPAFWKNTDKPFYEIDQNNCNKIGPAVRELRRNEMYSDGSASLLEENIQRISAGHYGRILYFGDNYSTDILAAETIAHWDGVCIMEELGEIELGEGYEENVWGHWQYEDTPEGRVNTFWYDYMSQNVAMCTSLTDSIELAEFYEL